MNKLKDLLGKIFASKEDQKPDCYSYLSYPQMYAENECYSCPWLERCGEESRERWNETTN
jgi:hypothetical protein